MKNTIEELSDIVKSFSAKFYVIPDAEFSAKPLAHKWSKKEVVGHLIDSGQNNLRRFLCGQYELTPSKIVYDQNFWVNANDYQQASKEDVITLWRLINQQICSVLGNMASENYSKETDTGKESVQLHNLAWLAEDYVKHLKHHVNQVIPHSFDIVYS